MNHIVIVGLGKTGLSCARYFERQQIPFSIIDTRDPLAPEILSKAKTIVLSPGVPRDHPLIQSAMQSNDPPEVVGDIELFARSYQGLLVAITGSNGKSTVTTLVGEMCKAAGYNVGVGGNLGIPVLELLEHNHSVYVLELSSFQLESTYTLKPSVAVVLNLSPDHLDRYASMNDYVQAKARIFLNAQKRVLNRDDPMVMQMASTQTGQVQTIGLEPTGTGLAQRPVYTTLTFGLDRPSMSDSDPKLQHYGVIEEQGVRWLARAAQKLIKVSDLKLLGNHNVANALAALALAEAIDLPMASSLQALRDFRGLAHRCEWVRTYKEIPFINDSKGTNVGATQASSEGLAASIPGKWVLIAGGVAKNADFSAIKESLRGSCRALILIGEAAEELETLFSDLLPCIRVATMEEAVMQALKAAQLGDGVLLSPMCASLDMFKNFEERGDVFKAIVEKL